MATIILITFTVLGLARQPFIGKLANQAITWMHELSNPRKQRPAP